MKPVVGITMGDAAGIGPEIILKVLSGSANSASFRPVILGSLEVLEFYRDRFSISCDFNSIDTIEAARFEDGRIDVIGFGGVGLDESSVGRISPQFGRAAVIYTQEAGKLALQGKIDAVVSAPLNKEAMRSAGFHYEGQTQILGELCGASRYGMILVLGHVRIMMLTTHVALRKACEAVTEDRVLAMLELADRTLRSFEIDEPRIAVAGLNPHAGEGGLFGSEEIQGSTPAIDKARKGGINAIGPVPADVVFLKAKEREYDMVLAMYHDQANMAAKLLGFGEVVTLLAGLPIIRTSVGHGTAFDIAGKGMADATNFARAIEVAVELALQKRGKKQNG